MPRHAKTDHPRRGPDWETLYRTAEAQSGYFTRADARAAGFSSPLLHHHVANGQLQRSGRGVYRLVRFPASDHEDLVVAWLWSSRTGVFSHETALMLHRLSDALPRRIHLTLPAHARRRRLRVPTALIIHHADVAARDRTWFDAIPITSAARTLNDLAGAQADPGIVAQGLKQGLRRGLFSREDVTAASHWLAKHGKAVRRKR